MKFLSPISGIDVTHSGNAVLKIQSDSTTNSHAAKLQLSHMRPSGDAYSSSSLYMDTFTTYLSADEAFALQTNGATRLYVHGSGNVGIGNSNPLQKLHVGGNIHMDGGIIRFPTNVGSLTLSNVSGSWNSLNARGINIGDWQTAPSYGDIRVGDYDFDIIKTDNTNLLRVKNNGNVGIGTTSPSYKLDISGGKLRVTNSGTTQLLINSSTGGSRELVFQSNGSTKAYVWNSSEYIGMGKGQGSNSLFVGVGGASEGNVGIGTSTPSDRLTVHNGGATTRAFIYNSGGSGHEAKVEVYTADDGAGHSGGIGYLRSWGWGNAEVRLGGNYIRQAAGQMQFISSGQVVYFNTGNVGIGTASPSEKLDVSGTIKGHSINIGSGTSSLPALHFGADTNTGIYRPSGDTLGVSVGGNLRFQVTNNLVEAVKINSVYYPWTLGSYDSSYASITSLIGGSTFGSLINGPNSGQIVVKINNNDNDDSFSIVSNSANGGNVNPDRLVFRTKANGYVYLPSAGARLHVGDGSNGGGLRFGDESDRNAIIYGSSQLQIKTSQSQGITFKTTTSGTERMRITSDGNVGIGTTNPVAKLDVAGSQRIVHSSGAAGLEVYTNSAIPTVPQVKIGRDSSQYYGIQVDDSTARLIHRQDETGTGSHSVTNEIWTSASGGGTWTWRLRENSGAFIRDEMSLNNDGLSVYGSINVKNANTNLSQANSAGVLKITTSHGWTNIGAANSSWSHFDTDRAQFYFSKPTEFNGSVKPYVNNNYGLGSSSKQWNGIYGRYIYQDGNQVLATQGDVHTALYNTGGNADDYDSFGVYRNYGEGQPTGLGHNTILNVVQRDGNYGWQITSSTANGGDSMWYRQKGTTFGDGSWHQIASRSWVTAQGYGDATQAWVQAQGYITSVPSEYLTQTEGDARYVTPIYNGANDNSGKADFAVGTGGYGAVSLRSNQVQIGSDDMNYTGRFDANSSYVSVRTWDRDLLLMTNGASSGTNIQHIRLSTKPNGGGATERVRIDGAGYTYFHGLQLAISNTNSSHGASNYFRGDSTHLVIGTGGTLHLNYGANTTVLHGTNVYPSTNGVANLGTSSAYFNRTYTNSLQGGGYTQINDYSGGSTWYMRSNGNFIFSNGHDWTLSFGLYMNQNGVPNDTFVELGQRTSNEENGRYKGIRIVKRENNTTVNGDFKAGKIQVEANQNGIGSQIEFNDNIGGNQRVYLTGYHADGSSYGGGASLHLTSTEPNVTMVSERYHSIQHGTSANWKQAYDWGNHASAGYLTSYTETDTLATVTARGQSTGRALVVTAVDSGNPSAAANSARLSGYGVLGNRGTFYLTNGGGVVQIGVGASHNDDPVATFGNQIYFEKPSWLRQDLNLDDNAGNSPALKFVSGDDTIFSFYKEDNNNTLTLTRQDNGGADFRFVADPSDFNQSRLQIAGEYVDANKISNWDTAYGWGNHASAGYLTSVPNHSAALITSGTLDGNRLPWASNDGFTGTYPIVWKATGDNRPYTASWLSVNGTLDQLNSKAFGSYVGDTGVILQSYNASASNAEQFKIRHNNGSVDIANPRGNIYFETPTYFETTTVAQTTLYVGNSIQHWGDGGTGMYFEQNDFISVRTAAANRLIVGTDGKVYFGSNTNKGYLREFASNTYGSQIGKIARITFTGGFSDWDSENHAIVSKDINGSMSDSLSVNSFNDVTIRLDSNNNNATSHFYITNDTLGSAMNNRLLDINTGTNETEIATAFIPYTDRLQTLGRDDRRWQIVFCETLDSAGQHESNLQDEEQPISQYATGTVLSWKDGKNRPCTQYADHMRMGIAVEGQDSPLIQGAEPVLVTGVVEEGDYLVTSEKKGHAVAVPRNIVKEQMLFDCVIGKALENGEGDSHLIKTWINI